MEGFKMLEKNKLGVSQITGKSYVGNVKNGMWTKKELADNEVIDFILNYLIYFKNDVTISGEDGEELFRITLKELKKKEELVKEASVY